jgi:hypothetical protein
MFALSLAFFPARVGRISQTELPSTPSPPKHKKKKWHQAQAKRCSEYCILPPHKGTNNASASLLRSKGRNSFPENTVYSKIHTPATSTQGKSFNNAHP